MKRGSGTRLMNIALLAMMAAVASPALMAAELTPADYTGIQQLYARYNTAIDRGDAEGWAATFIPDGSFMNNKGTDALKKFVTDWHAGQGASQRHFSADLVITPSADGATGTVSAMLVQLARPNSISAYVTYSDVLVKTAAGWRFKSRALKAETAPAAAPAGGAAPAGAGPPPRPAAQ
ncbi:MAG: nuclear transport factor 2 family protein [Pseudomonadota bacterium]